MLAINNMDMIVAANKYMSFNFLMKDTSEVSYVLGVKILRDCSWKILGLSQETYIKSILEWFWMKRWKPIDSPIAKGKSLGLEMGPKTTKEK